MIRKPSQLFIEFFKRADIFLFLLCLICSVFGIVIISSATATYETTARYIIVQSGAFVLGCAAFILLTVIDIDIIADNWPVLCVFNVLFLMSLLIWGDAKYGNTGWIYLGFVSVQPTEVVKYIFIVVMAKHIYYLSSYKDINSPFSVAQLALHFIAIFGLVLFTAEDLGSALVYFFAFIVMLFVAGLKLYWFAAGIAAVAAALPFIWTHLLREYHKNRILAPYIPHIVDPKGDGVTWQASNSKIALGSGRHAGTGLFKGRQSQSPAIPEKHSDFIFAVAGEELGMIGCCIILALLIAVIIRCVYIGLKSKNQMNMIICFGIAATIFFQTFENIGMCVGLTPVIGITLPFFSYGGSSLLSTIAAMGIVSGIKYRPKPERFSRY